MICLNLFPEITGVFDFIYFLILIKNQIYQKERKKRTEWKKEKKKKWII